ncbi:MAG TPA: winged helix-turn-helix domain-containing protein [Micromonosporaceae bacterium]|nr:winged helix-turn-helix domain-containing protein [Micromonosporaceae bacterium]
MSSGTSEAGGDTGALRATAHPTRLAILTLLERFPALTATECARLLGLSAKTCSYHLHTLAAHGHIEEVPAPGRVRPWRRVVAPADGPVRAAAERTLRARQRRDDSLLGGAMEAVAAAAEAPEWSVAATVHHRVARMSATELAAWVEDVERLTRRHVRRSILDDGARREQVALLFYGFPSVMAEGSAQPGPATA